MYEGTCDYPGLEPLYLALPSPHDNYRDLDTPLWIASSYALPRSCEYLLERGASPNNLSNFGMEAMHLAVRRRLPWRNFSRITNPRYRTTGTVAKWSSFLLRTVSILLHFGGDPNLNSTISRNHRCGPWCWGSLDCEHRGQRVLHFASASGENDDFLLKMEQTLHYLIMMGTYRFIQHRPRAIAESHWAY